NLPRAKAQQQIRGGVATLAVQLGEVVTPPRKSRSLRARDLSALPQGEGWALSLQLRVSPPRDRDPRLTQIRRRSPDRDARHRPARQPLGAAASQFTPHLENSSAIPLRSALAASISASPPAPSPFLCLARPRP